jgi:hypothetical protein
MKESRENNVTPLTEVVLASDEPSKIAHKELYHFHDDSYRIVWDDLLETIAAFEGKISRVHISSNWTDIVRLATWRSKPSTGDVFFLLRNMGIRPEELLPFRDSDISDLFPWLYYGKRVDILRKICLAAKTNAERHMKNRDTRVHCHLSSGDTSRIVASSL